VNRWSTTLGQINPDTLGLSRHQNCPAETEQKEQSLLKYQVCSNNKDQVKQGEHHSGASPVTLTPPRHQIRPVETQQKEPSLPKYQASPKIKDQVKQAEHHSGTNPSTPTIAKPQDHSTDNIQMELKEQHTETNPTLPPSKFQGYSTNTKQVEKAEYKNKTRHHKSATPTHQTPAANYQTEHGEHLTGANANSPSLTKHQKHFLADTSLPKQTYR
jgi:hypothetical protein